jgi:hypothetical protein
VLAGLILIDSNRRAAGVDRRLFDHVPLDQVTDAEQILGARQQIMIQDFHQGTTPSFPHAFGGNPAQRSFLDSRQKHAGMTI